MAITTHSIYLLLGIGLFITIIGIILLGYGRNLSRKSPEKARIYNLIGLIIFVIGAFVLLTGSRFMSL